MPEALILGAGGFLGLHALDALRALGEEPRCGRRARSNVLGLRSRKARMASADLDDEASLVEAMRGCDRVLHLAGHYPRTSLDPATATRTGLEQSRRVLNAAAAAGVQRLVYVSSTATVAPNPEGLSDERHSYPSPPSHGLYHALKWQMERLFLDEQRFEVRVACPSGCLGPGDLRVGTSALLIALARGMDPPHPDGTVALVDARDVGQGLARLLLAERAPKRLILSAENHRLHELLCSVAPRYGVPEPSPALSAAEAIARADEEEARSVRENRRPALSREIVDLVVHGQPLSARLAEEQLGLRWTPLSQTLDALDAWARRLSLIPSAKDQPPCSAPPTRPASSASSPT